MAQIVSGEGRGVDPHGELAGLGKGRDHGCHDERPPTPTPQDNPNRHVPCDVRHDCENQQYHRNSQRDADRRATVGDVQPDKMSEPQTMLDVDCSLNLRVGEWVEVRSAEEILATLDDRQDVGGLPFMPEMLQFCEKQFRVSASAHKTADTIDYFCLRRMENAVHLEGLRCDGVAHGGCQSGCLLFWKERWLRRVPDEQIGLNRDRMTETASTRSNLDLELQKLSQATMRPAANGGQACYRCQATEMRKATSDVRRLDRWNPLFYVRDLTSGNVQPLDFIRFGLLAMLNSFSLQWFNCRCYPLLRGVAGPKTPSLHLNLQAGELVRVRSKREIARTLNSNFQNRGMWFDVEMALYCEKGKYQVLRRVEKIINERTGEMLNLKNPCIILKGATCSGNYLHQRMFSRRRDYFFWREVWLERVST
jgi:hypothetical protein